MRKIIPYKTQRNALASLDNGGRFYNMFTYSNDGEISKSELAKVAGLFSDKQKMFLFLDMSLAELDNNAVKSIHNSMTTELQLDYRRYKAARYTPAQAIVKGNASQSAIITGIPHYIKSKSDFTGFIMMPIITGNVTTFIMIPITDRYDIYEVHDLESPDIFVIAHAKGAKKLSDQPTRFGGIIKQLKKGKNSKSNDELYLEALYYSICAPNQSFHRTPAPSASSRGRRR